MDIDTGDIIAGEQPSSNGFCPVVYVPDWWDLHEGETSLPRSAAASGSANRGGTQAQATRQPIADSPRDSADPRGLPVPTHLLRPVNDVSVSR